MARENPRGCLGPASMVSGRAKRTTALGKHGEATGTHGGTPQQQVSGAGRHPHRFFNLYPLPICLYQFDARKRLRRCLGRAPAPTSRKRACVGMGRCNPNLRKWPQMHFRRRMRPSPSIRISTGSLSTVPPRTYPPLGALLLSLSINPAAIAQHDQSSCPKSSGCSGPISASPNARGMICRQR